jgi:hypothetical protein
MLDHEQYSRVINEIRQKWEKAERSVIDCDPKSVYTLSEVDVLLEKYKEYQHGREWRVLSEDQEITKKEFAVTCICEKKRKK